MAKLISLSKRIKQRSPKEAYLLYVMTSLADSEGVVKDKTIKDILTIVNRTSEDEICLDTIKYCLKGLSDQKFFNARISTDGIRANKYFLCDDNSISLTEELLSNKDLSIDAKGFIIKVLCCSEDGLCQLNNTHLAKEIDMSRPTIIKYKKECARYITKIGMGMQIDSKVIKMTK